MSERFKEPVLKTGEPKGSVSSNLTPSAKLRHWSFPSRPFIQERPALSVLRREMFGLIAPTGPPPQARRTLPDFRHIADAYSSV